jgi:hypothetical protein
VASLIVGILMVIINRKRLLETYGQYEKQILTTMGSII